MGITNLIPFLSDSSRPIHISEFKGATVAVDSYCWLHKGAYSCCDKLARGEDTNSYVLYCLKYVRMLQYHNIKPIMVFDGQYLPAKEMTERQRRERKSVARKRAAELLRLDKPQEAQNYLRQCIDVTHEMALALIRECRKNGVDCIVAPYEADAQLAYLNMQKIADVVITEDSDLTLFGCDKIIFKLDLNGNGLLVDTDKLHVSMKIRPDLYSFDKFRHMCILSGCDYLQSLPGIGLKKALKFVKLTANPDIHDVLQKLPSYLNMKQLVITDEYRDNFMIADATFKHQVVFDPITRKLTRLNDPSKCGTKQDHLRNAGEFLDEKRAFQLALGNLDPFSLKQVDNWNPDNEQLGNKSIWSRFYTKQNSAFNMEPQLKIQSTRKISVEINTDLLISEKDDYDKQLEEQFKQYTFTCKAVEDITVEKEVKPPSPVLSRKPLNPFVKQTPLKKLSKFPRTVVDQKCVVKSRFFEKTTQEVRSPPASPEKQPNAKKTKPESHVLELAEEKTLETTEKELELIEISEEESDLENLTPPCSGNSSGSISPQKCESRKLFTPCRTVGLPRKKKAIIKNQPTLLSMFSSMQRKC